MRIVMLALGTHGDVRPVVALGRELHARGADVRLVTGTDHVAFVERNGLEAASAGVDFQEILSSPQGFTVVESGNGPNFITLNRTMKNLLERHNPTLIEACHRACADADAVVSGFTSDLFAVSIAEKLGIAHISAQLSPAPVATRDGSAMAIAPKAGRESLVNLVFHRLMIEPFNWRLANGSLNAFRTGALGLPPQRKADYLRRLKSALIVQGISPSVVAHPRDWPGNVHTTGYWFLDDATPWTPPARLTEFLSAGRPPVFIGFGSMTARDADEVTGLATAAAAGAGQRAIVQSGWAGLGAGGLPDSVLAVGQVPHTWLFEHVTAVVHHGGSGTTAAGLRAGLPTVIIPHFADQPFWGSRVAALGAGPQPIPWSKLSTGRLTAALREAVENPAMRRGATELGSRIRAENGVATAATLIERHLERQPTRDVRASGKQR